MTGEANGNGNVKQRAALWVGVVFLLGALLGSVSGYLFASHSHADSRPVLSDDERRAQKVSALTRELNLTSDQQRQLDQAIREAQIKIKAIRDASQPQIDATRAQAREKVRSFLTPEQIPKYQAYMEKVDAERKRNGQP
jgi:Spy/CpxP family protein refolding chaperone